MIGRPARPAPSAAGTVSSSASSIARFWLAERLRVLAGAQLARHQRQQRGADRDADHAERQLVDAGRRSSRYETAPAGSSEAKISVGEQVDLGDAGAERARQDQREQPPDARA